MRLSKVYVRFFRSFNYDFARKMHPGATPQPWEMIDGTWFPFIAVDLDAEVTAVVGANESGKSHLIKAIRCALTGDQIRRRDFCRYSASYSVEEGKVRKPDFGAELELTSEEDAAVLSELELQPADGRFRLFRLGDGENVFVGEGEAIPLEAEPLERLQGSFPAPFELNTEIALPQSINFDVLVGRKEGPLSERHRRNEFIGVVQELPDTETETVRNAADQMAEVLRSPAARQVDAKKTEDETGLARKLLFDVARIDKSSLSELEKALADEEEGEVDGLLGEMNRSLARHLNFKRWWRQDRDFELRLAPRERELVFTIRDRTGRNYSFDERSKGLKFFLSYYIQLKAHEEDVGERPEVLLMDEPDAYLSNMGQQDLLRTLESFAHPESGDRQNQVVYVTHSPFLINKNAAQRIRVLAKGSEEEGTLVVRDVSRNRYEPLRSALGSYVAETAFIGGANLFVEGISDQVLLAGMTRLLQEQGNAPSRLLDLNEVTIVPAGGADSVPYMAFLARGRDELKPPVVALLDGDKAGRDAYKAFERSASGQRKRYLNLDYVVDLGKWAEGVQLDIADTITVREPEDLIPIPLVAEAARRYATRFLEVPSEEAARFDVAAIDAMLASEGSVWAAVSSAFKAHFEGAEITKVGLAREVLRDVSRPGSRRPTGTPALEGNFKALLAHLSERLEAADDEEMRRRVEKRSDRIVKGFLEDYPDGALRDQVDERLREIEKALEDSLGDEAVRTEILAIRRDFKLGEDPLQTVADFASLSERMAGLAVKRREAYAEAEAEPAPAPRSTRAKRRPRRKAQGRSSAKPQPESPTDGGPQES